MSYKCDLCYSVVPSGEPLLKHIQYRKVKDEVTGKNHQQVMKETPVCARCNDCLIIHGMTVFQIVQQFRFRDPVYPNQLDETTAKKAERLKKEKIPFKYTVENGTLKVVEQRKEITNEKKTIKILPVCDLCGADASEGQVTPESILCHKHLSTKRKGRTQR